MLDHLRAHLGSRYSPDTVYHTMGQARLFLEHVGEKPRYTRDDITGYVDHLLDQGHKSTSVKTILASVHRLLDANKHPWPLEGNHLHLPHHETEGGPVLAPDEVGRLISGARTEGFPTMQIVALSTVYGLRSTEISRVLASGCDGKALSVQTAKAGQRRVHYIPPEVSASFQFSPIDVGRSGLHNVFDRLMKRYVREPRPGEGWHAVRRSVVTGLLDAGVPMQVVERFMGWRTREIVLRYYRPGRGAVDAEVYSKHPFLPMWEVNR